MNDFEKFMERKINDSKFSYGTELFEAILDLYACGYLDVDMSGEEPLISMSQHGKDAYAWMSLAMTTKVGEA